MKRAQATPPEIINAQSDRATAENYRDMQLQRYRIKYNDLQGQLKNLEDQLIPIRMLSTQQSAKHWFVKSSNHKNLGFVPGLGKKQIYQPNKR